MVLECLEDTNDQSWLVKPKIQKDSWKEHLEGVVKGPVKA